MTLWRLNIKTGAKAGFDPSQFCLSKNLAGVGWPVEDDEGRPSHDLEHYKDLGHTQYSLQGDRSWWPALNVLGYRMTEGDLCWTRDSMGTYYLGRITGSWAYLHGADADSYDIHSVRSCQWRKVGLLDAVPGAVERSFGPARTIQAIDDETASAFSEFVYSRLTGERPPSSFAPPDIFGLLSPLDHEDLAALYLQVEHDFVIVPSTVKPSAIAYEWVMLNKATGEKAVLQVKSGRAQVDLAILGKVESMVYVVASDETIDQDAPKNIRYIRRDTLLAFACRRRNILPKRIQYYLEWAGI